MKKTLLSTFVAITALSTISFGQTVVYDIPFDSLIGMDLTSGDICTAPFSIEEANQTDPANIWGAKWLSTNPNPATSMEIELQFTYSDSVMTHPTTLNGISSNVVDPGPAINCAAGPVLTWVIDPASYNSGAMNTFLVDFAGPLVHNQINNLPYLGDPFLRITVVYDAESSVGELTNEPVELVKIVDLMGRETNFSPNTPLIYMYSDGSSERIFNMK